MYIKDTLLLRAHALTCGFVVVVVVVVAYVGFVGDFACVAVVGFLYNKLLCACLFVWFVLCGFFVWGFMCVCGGGGGVGGKGVSVCTWSVCVLK